MQQNEIIVINSKNPLRLNVGYLYNKPIGTSREIPIEFDELTIDDILIKDLRSSVSISRTREGLLLQVGAEAQIQTNCARCLEMFYHPISVEFEELYQFPSRQREETDLILPVDGFIDLSPVYREYFILAMPIKRLCKLDCLGLCDICGENLNVKSCEHYPKSDSTSEAIEGGKDSVMQ